MTDPMWLRSQIDQAKQELESRPQWQQQAIREEVKASRSYNSPVEYADVPKRDQ